MIHSFASFDLDTDRCTLSRAGRTLGLRPQCYDLLLLLLERPGKVVGKDEMVERIWGGLAVTDDSLTQCVSHLRHSLGPEGADMIRTVPRRGYLLDAEVTREASTGPPAAAASRQRAKRWLGGTVAAAGLAGVAALAAAALQEPELLEPRAILATGSTIIGQPIAYPSGQPLLIAGTVLIAPGEASGWHSHDAPLFAYVLRGKVVVDYGPEGTREVSEGEGILEAVDLPHRALNLTDGWAEILYLSIGVEDVAIRTEEKRPEWQADPPS